MQLIARRAGFTLMELMIVVAIISFLAAMAMPQYQDYSARARLTEAFQMLAAARVRVMEFFISQGRMPQNEAEAGLVPLETAVVKGLSYALVNGVATLSVKVGQTGSSEADGRSFSMEGRQQSGTVIWQCRPGDAGGADSQAVPARFLPANCRVAGGKAANRAG